MCEAQRQRFKGVQVFLIDASVDQGIENTKGGEKAVI